MLNEEIEKVISGFTPAEQQLNFMLIYRENEFLKRNLKNALDVQEGLEKELNALQESAADLYKEVERYREEIRNYRKLERDRYMNGMWLLWLKQ